MKQRKGIFVLIAAMVAILILAFLVTRESAKVGRRFEERQEIIAQKEVEAEKEEEKKITQPVSIFFIEENRQCDTTKEVQRKIQAELDPVRASVVELLQGPVTDEKNVKTLIPRGTNLLDLKIINGVARIHFSKGLQDFKDDCQARGIKAQINETLKQFQGIHSVVITIEGVLPSEVLRSN